MRKPWCAGCWAIRSAMEMSVIMTTTRMMISSWVLPRRLASCTPTFAYLDAALALCVCTEGLGSPNKIRSLLTTHACTHIAQTKILFFLQHEPHDNHINHLSSGPKNSRPFLHHLPCPDHHRFLAALVPAIDRIPFVLAPWQVPCLPRSWRN